MKKININPVGLKGNEINERIIQLMGKTLIQEDVSRSVVELTKIGPDGKAYGIVRENHEYYIKVSDKTSNLVTEDFKYIGGLQNKKAEAYPSYSKAVKHLSLTFKSIAEAMDKRNDVNIFVNDKLMKENQGIAGFSQFDGAGFSGAGNLNGNSALYEEEDLDECGDDMMMKEEDTKNNPWAICTASVGRDDKEKYESCVKDVKKEKGISESITEDMFNEGILVEDVDLSEDEMAVDAMLEEDDDKDEEVPENPEDFTKQPATYTKKKSS